MKRRGMTHQQLARELGVNESTVGRWLSGRSHPAAGTLRHIGTILGLNLGDPDPAGTEMAEENELLDAFRRMAAAERRLLLHCLRERDNRCNYGTKDDRD
jgi:transcriptional regulator with XRE-family HTH domain